MAIAVRAAAQALQFRPATGLLPDRNAREPSLSVPSTIVKRPVPAAKLTVQPR